MSRDRRASERLSAALRRLSGAPSGAERRAPPPEPDDDDLPDDDLTTWRRRTDHHLRKLDKQLTKQNRLLLMTLLSTVVDVALKARLEDALKALRLIP